MEGRTIPPGIVALSIVSVVALLLAIFVFDQTFFSEPSLSVDHERSIDDYQALFIKERFEYAIWTLDENRRNFEWSLRSTKYIFWLSMFISISGISFAFWQFAQASQFDRVASEADELTVKTQMATMSFRTRSVASLVMMVSIVYLMIYVAFLYPITNAPNALAGEQATQDAKVIEPTPPPFGGADATSDLDFDPIGEIETNSGKDDTQTTE